MSQEAVDFLTSYYPPGPWTVLADAESAGGRAKWKVCQTSDPSLLLIFIEEHNGKDNIYFPVNLVCDDLKTSPKDEDITALLGVPLDIDLPAGHSPETFEALLARVRDISPPATVIVASGGGIQAHWCLDAATPLTASKAVSDQVRVLADEMGGDHVQNRNRLMRVPGTMNVLNARKRSLGRTPASARLLEADWTRRYPPNTSVAAPPSVTHSLDDLEPVWRERITTGSVTWLTRDRTKSAAVWHVVLHLVSAGWSDKSITTILLDPDLGISAHILKQPHPIPYAAKQVRNARLVVDQDYHRTRKEITVNRIDNVERALARINITLNYDQFASVIQWVNGEDTATPNDLDDRSVVYLRRAILQKEKFQPAKDTMWDTCLVVAHDSPVHPLREWFNQLPPWDGVPRTETWLIRHGAADDNPYVRAVSRIVLVAAVTRAFSPGVKFDEMLVLENPQQGTDKSAAIRALCPREEWFDDSLQLDASSKETIEQLAGKWIVEVQELAGMKQRDVERLKSFLSRAKDRARLAYARAGTDHFRTCVLLGTTNSTRYLRDEQNRRFWPVRVQRMNSQAIREERDQLWAEALHLFQAGSSIRLPQPLWELATFEQDARRVGDPWFDDLDNALAAISGRMICSDAFKIIGLDRNPAQRGQESNYRVGAAMRELKWDRLQAKVANRVVWVYQRGATPEERRRNIYVTRDPVTGEVYVGYEVPGAAEPADTTASDLPF